MRAPILVAALGAAVLLSACGGATRRCASSQSYEKAETLAIPVVPGLTVPDSASALKIPAAPASSEPFGKKVDDPAKPGEKRYECLDVPPSLNPPPPPPPPEAPKPAKS